MTKNSTDAANAESSPASIDIIFEGETVAQATEQPDAPPPLNTRVRAGSSRGINKKAIVASVGLMFGAILILASSGLTQTKTQAAERKPLMSDPAQPEMAQKRLGELPQSYDDDARFKRVNVTPEDMPQLGAPMAGDVAAFAPGADLGVDPTKFGARTKAPGYQAGTGPSAQNTSADEAESARNAGLFFKLQDGGGKGATFQKAAAQAEDSPDRNLTTSPHKLVPAFSSRSLLPGTSIPASLITAINSEMTGPIIAQITQNVYDSVTGQLLLIPQGAKLIGGYRSSTSYGQKRLAVVWARLIMPDGAQIVLDEAAADMSGAAGIEGKTDNHWGDVFGAAAMGTLINVGAAATEDRNTVGLTYNGIGVINGDDPVEEALRNGVKRTASSVSNRIVDRGLSIPPTIRIKQGAKVSVIVTRELVF